MAPLPTHIGPYRIVQLLGEGGMGVVYEAEESAPVRRRVALKLVRAGLDDAQDVLARFDAERRALAVMNHPGIARVLQAGSTDTGQPYFAMELVRGLPLTEYCDARRLSVRDRLLLFAAICEAVQHAHQKGVIHRDLKPSNVLVTDEEGVPTPKIIDFGIAKALGPANGEQVAHTMRGHAMGTVAYMSPEQANHASTDVDTRADIFSLGVMLFELLVGELPVDPVKIGVYEFLTRLSHGDTRPPTPSTGLANASEHGDRIAELRRTDRRHLQRELRGDLDWIVMKAMHADRTQRYETANGLAADLRRYLTNEPVTARPPSTRYRVGKFVQRHRLGVVTASSAAAVVLFSSVVATVGFVQARRAERRAEQEAEAAQQVTTFLVDLFRESDPNVARRGTLTARELLERGTRRISTGLVDQPQLQSRIMQTMGSVQASLGQYGPARTLLEDVLRVRERELGPDHLLVGETLSALGEVARDRGEFEEADRLLTRALAIRQAAHRAEHVDVATSMSLLASLRWRQGRNAQAESLFKQVLAIDAKVRSPGDPRTARDMRGLGSVYLASKRFAEAESLFKATLALQERTQGEDAPDVGSTLNNLGTTYYLTGRYTDALPYYEKARRVMGQSLGPDHPQMASIANNLGEVYWKVGQHESADTLFRQALAVKERTLAPENPSIAVTLNGLAGLLRDRGRYAEAEPLYRRALALREAALGVAHPDVAETRRDFGELLRRAGRVAEAARLEAQVATGK
jgi:non-specific serine/threonine protein kinase/serine/threonine-protein kinase